MKARLGIEKIKIEMWLNNSSFISWMAVNASKHLFQSLKYVPYITLEISLLVCEYCDLCDVFIFVHYCMHAFETYILVSENNSDIVKPWVSLGIY